MKKFIILLILFILIACTDKKSSEHEIPSEGMNSEKNMTVVIPPQTIITPSDFNSISQEVITAPSESILDFPSNVIETFIDTIVIGLNYSCDGVDFITTKQGKFSCKKAPIVFKIGKLVLGSINDFTTDKIVYPQDILGLERSNFTDNNLIKLTRFIQSLDDDGDTSVSINIPSSFASKFSKEQTLSDLSVSELEGLLGKSLIDADSAIKHLKESMGVSVDTNTPSTDTSNDSNTNTTPINLNPLQSISIHPDNIKIRMNQVLGFQVEGIYKDGSKKILTTGIKYNIGDSSIFSIENNTIKGLSIGTTNLRASVDGINSNIIEVVVVKSLDTSTFKLDNFGTQYLEQIPIDATIDNYDEKRFCMIAGEIRREDGTALNGVKVHIVNQLKYGTTSTDERGIYSIPSEGGVRLVLRYEKEGYTTIDRSIQAPVSDWVRTPTVTMLEEDSKVTTIDFSNLNPQIHVSTVVNDERGKRSTTLVFDGITKATVTAPNGSKRELKEIKVRATEFKIPDSMPADLPIESAFTYCSDIKVDGVSDNEEVTFEKPVVMYVDNFLSFDVGVAVPIGYYDRSKGEWTGVPNGVVVKLLDSNNDGKIDSLDSNNDGNPNDLNGDGNFSDEVKGIADNSSFEVGKTYWRGEISHFTPWDFNWPYRLPAGAKKPDDVEIDDDDKTDDCKNNINSYITTKTRIFHEDIPVQGTDIQLHYASNRVEGYDTLVTVYTHETVPTVGADSLIQLVIAGKVVEKIPSLDSKYTRFKWNGKDVNGKLIKGIIKGKVYIGYRYPIQYQASANQYTIGFARRSSRSYAGGFDIGSRFLAPKPKKGAVPQLNALGYLWKTKKITIVPKTNLTDGIAKGWTLSNQNKAQAGVIFRGNGIVERNNNSLTSEALLETIAGGGESSVSSVANNALDVELSNLGKVEVDSKGNIYFIQNHRVLKIDTAGLLSVVAGGEEAGFSGDEGLATLAKLQNPSGLALDTDGNVFITDRGNERVRKVDKDGIITTVAGGGNLDFRYLGTDTLALDIGLSSELNDITIDKEGKLFILVRDYVLEIDNKQLSVVAGSLGVYRNNFFGMKAITIDFEGNLYILAGRTGITKIQKIDNQVVTFTPRNAKGKTIHSGVGAIGVSGASSSDIVADDDGNVFISFRNSTRIIRVRDDFFTAVVEGTSRFNGLAINLQKELILVASDTNLIRKRVAIPLLKQYNIDITKFVYKNSNNTLDIYGSDGRHLKIIDLNSGKVFQSFSYDSEGRLIAIRNQFDELVTIERDADGMPTTITAPNGQITKLVLDVNKNLVEVKYEDNSKYSFQYDNKSLMTTETDKRGHVFTHEFDTNGRFVKDIDAIGGIWTFSKSRLGRTLTYGMTKPMGDVRIIKDTQEKNGTISSEITLPTGDKIYRTRLADKQTVLMNADGVQTQSSYGTDSFTNKTILQSERIIQPSGLEKTTSYSRIYEGNSTQNSKTTVKLTSNSKTLTMVQDYINGTSSITSPQGRVASLEYDINTRLPLKVSVGSLTPQSFNYDSKGRLIKSIRGERSLGYAYDDKGNISTLTDSKGNLTEFSYDIMNRVVKIKYPNDTTEHFTYDKNGNTTKYRTARDTIFDFAFNGLDKRSEMKSPLKKSIRYTYNKNRRLTKIVKPSGKFISNHYVNDRLIQIQTAEGTIEYDYWFANKLKSVSRGTEGLSLKYDGSLLTEISQTGVLNHTSTYQYNNDFQLKSSSYAGVSQNYTYDRDNLLLSSGSYNITRDVEHGYTTSVTDGSLVQNRLYNSYGEISQVADNTFTYELTNRDTTGAIAQKKETINGTSIEYEYGYDILGKLIEVKKDGTTVESYAYDKNGNRASATINGVTTIGSYTLDDQLVVYGNNSYEYDDDGYLKQKTTPDGKTTYEYGTLGELKRVATSTKNIQYLHNANNQRVAKKVNGVIVEKYLWANLTTLVAIYDGSDQLLQRFEYADGRMPISMSKDGQKYYLHYDQVGSLRAVSDSSHTMVKEIVYDTYGNIISDSNEALSLPFGFAGGLYDKDTKLTRFGYRDYDAYTGKWTAKDPIDFGGGDANLYGYVLGDPVNFIDPLGTSWVGLGKVIVVIGVSAGTAFIVGVPVGIGIGIGAIGYSLYGIADYMIGTANKYCEMQQLSNEICYDPKEEGCSEEKNRKIKEKQQKILSDSLIDASSSTNIANSGVDLLIDGVFQY